MAIFELLDYIVNEVRAQSPTGRFSTPAGVSYSCWKAFPPPQKRIGHVDCGVCGGGAAGRDGDRCLQ